MKIVVTPEEQIAGVEQALRTVEGYRTFRGQDKLVADLRCQLQSMRKAQSRGELVPITYKQSQAWGQWVGLIALVAGALHLVSTLL